MSSLPFDQTRTSACGLCGVARDIAYMTVSRETPSLFARRRQPKGGGSSPRRFRVHRLYQGKLVMLKMTDLIIDADHSPTHDFGGDAAVPQHRMVAAGAQRGFHTRAGVAVSGAVKDRVTHAEQDALQCVQIDAGNHHVPPQQIGNDYASGQRGDDGQVFMLDQRDLPPALCMSGVVVPRNP